MRNKPTRSSFILSLLTLLTLSLAAFAQGGISRPSNIGVSDQKAGSILVFPYYTSSIDGRNDTNITISHAGNSINVNGVTSNEAFVHLYLIDGSSCSQADGFVTITPNGSITFNTSDYDPGISGYLIAVAVNGSTGVPTANNVLIGNAFIKVGAEGQAGSIRGNYGAEAFYKKTSGDAPNNGSTATIRFNGTDYDRLPNAFAAQIKSPLDVSGQQIIVSSLVGDLTTGSLARITQGSTGLISNADEKTGSFSNLFTPGCQIKVTFVAGGAPRVPGGLNGLLPRGQVGTVKFAISSPDEGVGVGGGVGLVLTPVNSTSYYGIRTLHKLSEVNFDLNVPVF